MAYLKEQETDEPTQAKAEADARIAEEMRLTKEAAKAKAAVEEGIVASAAEADMGLIYGLGFPPFRGGPLRYADTIGLANFVALADKYAHLGEIYQVTDKTRAMAQSGQVFYPV